MIFFVLYIERIIEVSEYNGTSYKAYKLRLYLVRITGLPLLINCTVSLGGIYMEVYFGVHLVAQKLYSSTAVHYFSYFLYIKVLLLYAWCIALYSLGFFCLCCNYSYFAVSEVWIFVIVFGVCVSCAVCFSVHQAFLLLLLYCIRSIRYFCALRH